MRCPFCRQPLPEKAPACPHCQFSLASAGHYFGESAMLKFPLADLACVLGSRQKRTVRNSLLAMSQTFPQLSFAAVLMESDARASLAAHAFWLFNTGGLNAAQESGGRCRLLLLVLDVKNSRAACIIGYGLEPFVQDEALDRIAAAALAELQRQDHAAAVIAALQRARMELAVMADAIPRGFGLNEDSETAGAEREKAAFAY